MINQTFGIEIEMNGITRKNAAELIAEYFGTTAAYVGTAYRTWTAKDTKGRIWKCMRDSSIVSHNDDEKCELVTPVLKYEDMSDLQEIVRRLRKAGAKSSAAYQCGIHVHIGCLDYTVRNVRNLVNFFSANQDLLYKAVEVNPRREAYCEKLGSGLVERFEAKRVKTRTDLEKSWYNEFSASRIDSRKATHYDNSRYHGLNLHSLFSKGTVEFRLFNGTLHAGLIRSYVVLALAICNYCKSKSRLAPKKEQKFNDRYTMYALLCDMGVKGEEFANCREHLTARLDGGLGHEARYTV